MTSEQLKSAMPGITDKNIEKYLPVLNKHLQAHGIDTPLRLAHFLAQVGHETLSFYYYREIASGEAYEGRKDLGNIRKGDGVKFKGRGAIQVTGRNNYSEASQFIFGDDRLLYTPELLELPEYGILAACWFWTATVENDVVVLSVVKAEGAVPVYNQNGTSSTVDITFRQFGSGYDGTYLGTDGLHPNAKGKTLISRCIAKNIINRYFKKQ